MLRFRMRLPSSRPAVRAACTRAPLALLLFALASAGAGRGAAIREVSYQSPVEGAAPREGLLVEGEFLRFGLIPAIGGRVVELGPAGSEKNYLHRAPWFWHLGPADKWQGAEYGGVVDAATGGWPGPFWGVPYEIETREDAGGVTVVATAEAEGIGIRRSMTLPRGESRLLFRIVQTNATDEPKPMVLRLHGEFRVGTFADENDVFFWREDDRLRTRRYLRGSESPRFTFDHPQEPWMAMVDTAERESLVHRFNAPGAPYRVMFWSGHPTKPPGTRENTGRMGFYNNERFGARKVVAPGESLEAEEEFWVLLGLPRVDACTGAGAAALALDRAQYGRNDKVRTEALFAAPFATEPVEVALALHEAREADPPAQEEEADGEAAAAPRRLVPGKVLEEARLNVPAGTPGRAAAAHADFGTGSLSDGVYFVTARFSRGEAELGAAARRFEIAGARAAAAAEAIETLAARVAEVREAWNMKDRGDALRVDLLEYRLSEAGALRAEGKFAEAREEARKALDALERTAARRQTERLPEEERAPALAPLLRRFRAGQ